MEINGHYEQSHDMYQTNPNYTTTTGVHVNPTACRCSLFHQSLGKTCQAVLYPTDRL